VITLKAPAKINLTLEVLGKRDDSYHEIRSIIQTISLCDVLHFQEADTIELKASMQEWLPEKSLIPGAVRLLQEATERPWGAEIAIEKNIPLISGLGGESSDAAAVLAGLNELWELGLSTGELEGIAAGIGSDVAFFLHGGTARLEGRGEQVTPLPHLPNMWVVLVIPSVPRLPGKTAQLYKSLKPEHFTDGTITGELETALREGRDLTTAMLFNTFENIAFQPRSDIETCRQHLVKIGAEDVHLAGTGPALFTLLKDGAQAKELQSRLQNQALETYLARTV
jgi:4-diphosphocytidyl-2-C-methyl-D-erythritol kinase